MDIVIILILLAILIPNIIGMYKLNNDLYKDRHHNNSKKVCKNCKYNKIGYKNSRYGYIEYKYCNKDKCIYKGG